MPSHSFLPSPAMQSEDTPERPLSAFGLNFPLQAFSPSEAFTSGVSNCPLMANASSCRSSGRRLATIPGTRMLPLWGVRINSVAVKSSTRRFLDTESFDNRMITITKREECHAWTECLSIRAAHQHCFVPHRADTGRRGHARSADQC